MTSGAGLIVVLLDVRFGEGELFVGCGSTPRSCLFIIYRAQYLPCSRDSRLALISIAVPSGFACLAQTTRDFLEPPLHQLQVATDKPSNRQPSNIGMNFGWDPEIYAAPYGNASVESVYPSTPLVANNGNSRYAMQSPAVSIESRLTTAVSASRMQCRTSQIRIRPTTSTTRPTTHRTQQRPPCTL